MTTDLPADLPIRLYLRWSCGDGCCSNSQQLEYPAGQFATTAALLAHADPRVWVYDGLYDDPDWLRFYYEDGVLEIVYERPEEEDE